MNKYTTPTFREIYPSYNRFVYETQKIVFPSYTDENGNVKKFNEKIFNKLLFKYGGFPILTDVKTFKERFIEYIASYTIPYLRQLEMQEKIYNIKMENAAEGNGTVQNVSNSPAVQGQFGTETMQEMQFINNQVVYKNKRGIIESTQEIYSSIIASIHEQYLKKFLGLFVKFPVTKEFDQFKGTYISNTDENIVIVKKDIDIPTIGYVSFHLNNEFKLYPIKKLSIEQIDSLMAKVFLTYTSGSTDVKTVLKDDYTYFISSITLDQLDEDDLLACDLAFNTVFLKQDENENPKNMVMVQKDFS